MKRIQIGGASLGNLLLRFVQGLIIGVGGILPGVSGGVLCIVFGLYQPVMEVFAAPIRNLKKHFALLAPVADFFVQVCLMVVGFAVALAFDRLGKRLGCE